MHKTEHSWKIPQGGYSLVEIMVAVALVGMILVLGGNLYSDYQQDQVGQARGKQMGSGLELLEKFARKYQTSLTAGQAISGVVNPYSPTTAELRTLGFAPSNFGDATQPGGPIMFLIAREPSGCATAKCILSLKAVTSGSVLSKGEIDSTLAQNIAGNVPNGAGWTNLVSDVTKLGKNGITIPNPLGNVPAVVAAVSWLGSNQASATTPPVSYNYRSLSCGAGYSGVQNQQQSVTTDKWGSKTEGNWVEYSNSCELLPPTPTGSYTNTTPEACPSGYSGSILNEQTCTTWSYGPATCSVWSQSVNTCKAPPPPVLPPPPPCANGAGDYPTCTPPVFNPNPPPIVENCPFFTGLNAAYDIPGPKGTKLVLTVYQWGYLWGPGNINENGKEIGRNSFMLSKLGGLGGGEVVLDKSDINGLIFNGNVFNVGDASYSKGSWIFEDFKPTECYAEDPNRPGWLKTYPFSIF